jgi:outer membrane protein assembly factor BamB
MRYCPALFAGLALAGPAFAQSLPATTPPVPDRAVLDRLHLRNEWAAYIPLTSQKDGVGIVQPVDAAQIFVQTRSGLLVAVDANSGAKQWTFRYPAQHSSLFPVAVNKEFVFAVNVSRLFGIHRYTGVIEFDYELPGPPTSGPAADNELVYLILNGMKVVAYRFPTLLRLAEKDNPDQNKPAKNPVDELAERYTLGAPRSVFVDEAIERPSAALPAGEPQSGLSALQRTPSLSALPSVRPPYTIHNRGLYATPSLAVVTSMRQPYQFRPDYMRFNQRTPSISAIPPSIARVYELANLRPKGIEPTQEWVYSSGTRLTNTPVRVSGLAADGLGPMLPVERLWITTDGPLAIALDATTGKVQMAAHFLSPVAAPMGGPVSSLRPDRRPTDPDARTLLGFVPLADGIVAAVDLLGGHLDAPRIEWKSNVGGLLNHRPLATPEAVYISGDHAGVTRVDPHDGGVVWKTAPSADRALAANGEFVYVFDRTGNLLVYGLQKPSDAASNRISPLARLPLPGYDHPVTNHYTDRILLAADKGILISLRDASAKYARPVLVNPPPPPPAPPKKPNGKEPAEPAKEEGM